MTGLTVHVHAESALDVARRNALSCQEIIKVGVESGANNEFKGVNNSYLHDEGGKEGRRERAAATLSVHTSPSGLSLWLRRFMMKI